MWLRFKNINKALKEKLESNTKNLKLAKKSDRWAILIQIDRELDPTELIHKIRCVHIELEELCFEITKVYGTSIVLTMIGKFILITGFMFQEVATLGNRSIIDHTKIPYTIIFLTWFLPSAFTFISINYVCEQTIEEWKQTKEILARFELESKDLKLQEEIRNFSSQTQKNSLKFSPCGLFDLGSYFITDRLSWSPAKRLLSSIHGVRYYMYSNSSARSTD
ncbi:hypothetical protein KQX54_006163 [Cotesia glomerata]|uniref:Gustatory receptor n=1 Tax=Cotesia glomerata TaxID=32391 RepID=A0AAV7J4Q0_COTGL|nr:hypothetical protein KQX54_006163 [Cotesia glomerata]